MSFHVILEFRRNLDLCHIVGQYLAYMSKRAFCYPLGSNDGCDFVISLEFPERSQQVSERNEAYLRTVKRFPESFKIRTCYLLIFIPDRLYALFPGD